MGTILTFHYDFFEKSTLKFGANAKYSEHIGLKAITPANYPREQHPLFEKNAEVGELSSSLFTEYSQGLGKFRLILGASLDRIDTTKMRLDFTRNTSLGIGVLTSRNSIGSNYTFQGVLYYDFLQGHSLHINVGKKYRMPSLRGRYSTEDYDFVPNPNLKL